MEQEQAAKKNSSGKGKKVAKIIGNVLFYTVVGFMLIVGIIAVIGKITGKGNDMRLFGYNFFVVGSSSMAFVNDEYADFLEGHDDRIAFDSKKGYGDLIITKSVPDSYELKVYDVVTFVSGSNTIVHRIVEIVETDDGIGYITRGDSNNTDDGMRKRSDFTGILVKNAGMGWAGVIHFVQSGYGIAAISGSMGIMLAAMFVSMIMTDRAKKKKPATVTEGFEEWSDEALKKEEAQKEQKAKEEKKNGKKEEKKEEVKEREAPEPDKREPETAEKKPEAPEAVEQKPEAPEPDKEPEQKAPEAAEKKPKRTSAGKGAKKKTEKEPKDSAEQIKDL